MKKIETKRLLLRDLKETDVRAVHDFASDPRSFDTWIGGQTIGKRPRLSYRERLKRRKRNPVIITR